MLGIIADCIVICLILSIDVFLICFNYGFSKIKIPLTSIFSITLINFIIAGVGTVASFFVSNIISEDIVDLISIGLLFLLGSINLIKYFLSRKKDSKENHDKNNDKVLSPSEALILALILTPDGFCAALSCGTDYRYIFTFLGFFFIFTFLSVFISSKLGFKLSKKIRLDLSWLSPICLIVFSIVKLILMFV